ncbi:MAG: Nif3-like dinuclear metal center hexameric protein [bacterium]|nr:Nif3-like dinuclear metal center hexameric protein [bacterium]
MVLRNKLTQFLSSVYDYKSFEDGCENGLQVEGKEKIEKILFGVSFNQPFLEQVVKEKADAVIVHHGIFQKGVFKLKGPLKQKIKLLLDNEISLFGIHLPMDAHAELGHNALLLSSICAQGIEPFDLGFSGENAKKYSLDRILEIFHEQLHPESFAAGSKSEDAIFAISVKHGFTVLANGPEVPRKMAIVTGGSSGWYEQAIEAGADTFFGGDIKEKIPAISLDTKTNFVNLGHYFSEKPGVLALKKKIEDNFEVQTGYIEIPNPI